MVKMKIRHLVFSAAVLAAMAAAAEAESELPGGWSPKFYDGLEAVGSVKLIPGGFKDKNFRGDRPRQKGVIFKL